MARGRVTLDSRESFRVRFRHLAHCCRGFVFQLFRVRAALHGIVWLWSQEFSDVETTINDNPARARYASTFSIRFDIGAIWKCIEIARRLSGGLAL